MSKCAIVYSWENSSLVILLDDKYSDSIELESRDEAVAFLEKFKWMMDKIWNPDGSLIGTGTIGGTGGKVK